MAQRIDDEINRMVKLGQTPRIIEVGNDLYEELLDEQNPALMAPLIREGEKAPVYTQKEVRDYKCIAVFNRNYEPRDYLNILT